MTKYIYTYVHHEDEYDLCRMEMRAFFGKDTKSNYIITNIKIDPSRSPFIEDQLEVYFESDSLDQLIHFTQQLEITEKTFKVVCLNKFDIGKTKKITHPKRRAMERELGLTIEGEPELDHPEIVLGLLLIDGRWYFGKHTKSESIWRKHVHKPNSYSTALNTRVARSICNIAVPQIENVRAIDPCCGIGTVVIEALSMDIKIVGRDLSPLVCHGARENIAHFKLDGEIVKGPIAEVTEHYDVAIVDLPYNIYCLITPEEELDIIRQARRIADRVVFVTVDSIDHSVESVGFTIIDRCVVKKQSFKREILLCE